MGRLNGVATLSSCLSVEANALSTTEGEFSTSEDKTNSLTEDEQLQVSNYSLGKTVFKFLFTIQLSVLIYNYFGNSWYVLN